MEYKQKLNADSGKVARNYLASRGILESSSDFDIGYCDSGYFANRVIFPVYDLERVPRNLTSRLVSNEKTSKSHLHLPKVKMDWFFNECLLSYYGLEYIVVCESPIDCITLCQNGIHSVASMGAHNINKGKIEKLKHLPIVYICFDNDVNGAGQKAATRIGEMMVRAGLTTFNIHIPFISGPDINAMFTKSQTSFMKNFYYLMEEAKRVVVIKSKPKGNKNTNYKEVGFDILLVAEEYMELQNMGPGKYKGICPLHSETKPSFYLDSSSNRWRCFGCGKGGDTIDLIRAIHESRGAKLSFKEALSLLGSKYHNSPPAT